MAINKNKIEHQYYEQWYDADGHHCNCDKCKKARIEAEKALVKG